MKSRILLFLLFISAISFAQDSSFQLKDYKYRTPGFQALALGLNFSGNYRNTDFNNRNPEKYNSTGLGPAFANYYRIRSTDKRFQETNASLSTSYSSLNVKEATRDEVLNRFETNFLLDHRSRTYRNNQWYFELGNRLEGTINSSKLKDMAINNNGSTLRGKNTVTLGIGKGRVEWVQDAQMALYILQDLAGQNLLSRQATAEESLAFAQLVTDINNRRIFDNRRRRIYELSRIDSFLKNTGLATQTDIRHFTTVNDNWAFAINPFRQSGASWFARVKPGIGIEKSNSKNNNSPQSSNDNSLTLLNISPEIGYENYKPVNLKWQRNFGVSVSYFGTRYYQRNKFVSGSNQTETTTDFYSAQYYLNSYYGIGYFPNTRTQLTGNIGLRGVYGNPEYWHLTPSLDLTINYFLGYRTYLTGNVTTRYTYYKSGSSLFNFDGNHLYGGFALHLSHFIF